MKINYVALDGKIFEDEFDCREYEEDLLFKTILKGVDCRDKHGKKITDLAEIGYYGYRISIDNNESYKKLCDVLEDNEISIRSLSGIDGAGEYVYDDDDDKFERIKSLNKIIEEVTTFSGNEIIIRKVKGCDLYYTI